MGSPTLNLAFANLVSAVVTCWSALVVWAWEPSQNSVDPVVLLKEHSGMLAITKKGHYSRVSKM